jgi:protein-S-isoprenylcysteine O-methyltransferase Ste14
MRLEYVPVVLGVLVLLIAAGIIYDAASPNDRRPFRERRRRQRAELNVPGEWLVALGTACVGVALIANEMWRWTTIVVLTGVVLIVLGAILNRAYLREVLLFRGAARRTEENEVPPAARKPVEGKLRIR